MSLLVWRQTSVKAKLPNCAKSQERIIFWNAPAPENPVTSGGIVGTVERIIDNEKVEVLISENVKVEIVRSTGIQSLANNIDPKK